MTNEIAFSTPAFEAMHNCDKRRGKAPGIKAEERELVPFSQVKDSLFIQKSMFSLL